MAPMAPAMLALALAAFGTAYDAGAADVTSYFTSSANQRPKSNAGFAVTGEKVRLKADVAMRAPGRSTQIVPNVSSTVTLSERVGLETRVDLAEWNSRTDLLEAKFDTRLHVRSPAPFLDELEGRIWRTPDGQSGRVLNFGFYQILREPEVGPAVTLRSLATVETTTGALAMEVRTTDTKTALFRPESHRVKLETELRGLLSGLLPGKSALRLRIEQAIGASPEKTRSLTYDHSWRVRKLGSFGFNLGMLHGTRSAIDVSEPSLGFSWHAEL